ncbi:MAG TPA: DinB family protein [Phycisphaerae bacterium]|nr:DinB family protein [Phycisphaerae bacterium]
MNADLQTQKEIEFSDLERELTVTRPVLARLPEEHYDWKPHEKSMNLGQLALHVAELPEWTRVTLDQDELDAANAPRPPQKLTSRKELLERFDKHVAGLRKAVERFDMANINKPWTMRRGGEVMVSRPRQIVYRIWCVNHMIHHRGQLCVYLRLLNVPVPTVYFNSADDPTWIFE